MPLFTPTTLPPVLSNRFFIGFVTTRTVNSLLYSYRTSWRYWRAVVTKSFTSSLLEERSCMERKIKLQTFRSLFRFFVCTAFGNGEIIAGDTCGWSTIASWTVMDTSLLISLFTETCLLQWLDSSAQWGRMSLLRAQCLHLRRHSC
jgi:hypothetical protein